MPAANTPGRPVGSAPSEVPRRKCPVGTCRPTRAGMNGTMSRLTARPSLPIAEALRLIRTRAGLTQTAAAKRQGAPDFRTLSHWETRRKQPSLRLLSSYLSTLDLDFSDLQDALDQIEGKVPKRLRGYLEGIQQRLGALEGRIEQLESNGQAADS